MADTQIDELRLDITVEDKTSGESSDKKVKNLATAISRLNKNLQAFDNKKMSSVFANMAKGIDPFIQKIDKVSGALNSLATIVSKMKLDKAVEETTKSISPLQKETGSGDGRAETKIQAKQGTAQQIDIVDEKTKQQISELAKKLKESQDATNKFFDKFISKGEKTEIKIAELKDQLSLLKSELASQKSDYQSTLLSGGNVKELKKKAQETAKEINKVQKQLDELTSSAKKTHTPLGKVLKSFGRIAMYRAIRTVIKEITQSFTESIDGIARYNSEFRDTMGSLQSSVAKLKTSMGVAFYQVLILIEPLITQIANGIANLSNSLSKVTANMRGVANYTKINTEYMKEYKSAVQGTLLSFDTFTTLSSNQGIDYSKIFDMGIDSENLTTSEEKLKNILTIFKEISNSIKEIWKAIKPSLEPILEFITDVLSGIGKLVIWLKDKELLTPALTGLLLTFTALTKPILLVIGLIGSIINSFSKMSTKTKILTGIVAGLAASLAAIVTPGGAIAKITAATITFAGISAIVANAQNVSAYANGGMFEGAGTMYALAGESGAEVVATGSSGTGVLNVDQFADAMVSALVRYGAARDNGSSTTIVLDGNKVGQLVASNVGFRNEANRRNAGLNWK